MCAKSGYPIMVRTGPEKLATFGDQNCGEINDLRASYFGMNVWSACILCGKDDIKTKATVNIACLLAVLLEDLSPTTFRNKPRGERRVLLLTCGGVTGPD